MFLVEFIGFAMVISFIWIDEVIDFPHRVLSAAKTPINWAESLFETAVVSLLACFVAFLTRRVLKRVKRLEGLLSICSFCKKIRVGDKWVPVDQYVRERSSVDFSHSLCPDCVREQYGPVLGEKLVAVLQKARGVK